MGKKGRKTRWRRLPIGGPESNASPPAEEQEANVAPSPEHRITFNEDEYTKITTPRQDVLFKKGYLGRRRANNPTPEAQELHSADSMESEYIPEEQPQFAYVPSTGFIDHTGVFYVNSGTYEIYDPYSGNVTVVVGPAPQYPPQPVLAAMPCQPVPLTPLEWFNPPAPWVCPYNNRRKRYSTDSQNCSAQSSESTGPPGSPQEPIDEAAAGVMYSPQPQPYMYPGYMFGAPLYNMNGVNVQGVMPQSPVPAAVDMTTGMSTKRRKKRRRRRRGGVTDEGSESSCEEVINCDVGVCSQSGASSDAGQGSSCSKTNSDSGINTEPTPDSGSNTPPPMPEIPLTNGHGYEETQIEEDCSQQYELENEVEVDLELNSSSISTPEAHKRTFESLPSEDGETLQELSYSSESNESKLTSSVLISCASEQTDTDSKPEPLLVSDAIECVHKPPEVEPMKTELDSNDTITSEHHVDSCSSSEQIIIDMKPISNDLHSPSNQIHMLDETDKIIDEIATSLRTLSVEDNGSIKLDVKQNGIVESINNTNEMDIEEIVNEKEVYVYNTEMLQNLKEELNEAENNKEDINEVEQGQDVLDMEENIENNVELVKNETEVIHDTTEIVINKQLEDGDSRAPVPPPRRRRSLLRSAEKVAKKVVDDVVKDGIKEAACIKCQHALPITEAVTRWLQTQGPAVLSANDADNDEDEGIEDGEGSTNQKNVEGNPFLAPYLSGSRKRVATDYDECGSLVSSAGEWDMYDHDGYTRAICDPATSVEKYYRLGADDLDDKITSPPSMIKTAVHIRRAGPFPCGVCCIIQ